MKLEQLFNINYGQREYHSKENLDNGETFVQLYPCCVDDNCLVLIPKEEYSLEYLFYIATVIRHHKWRFMYGRQITPERLGRVEVLDFEEFETKLDFREIYKKLIPKKQEVK